jgi:hypothetical protein
MAQGEKMIILKEESNLTEGKRPKIWFDYILDHLNSDAAFDILFNIFDGCPYPDGPLILQAVSALKKRLPSVPSNEIKSYVIVWVENHRTILKG